jgi:putative oxidoreductase
MMDKLELKPGRRNAMAAAGAETAVGALLALGALTPLAGTLITGTMLTAIRKVHAPKRVWNMDGGYEFNLTLIAAVTALVESGPGSASLDRALGLETSGSAWALASLAAGATGSTLAIQAGRRLAEQERAVEEMHQRGRFVRGAEAPERQPVSTSAERDSVRTSA